MSTHLDAVKDHRLSLNDRMRSMGELANSGRDFAMLVNLVSELIDSENFDDRFLGLRFAGEFHNAHVRASVRSLASWPSKEPFALRKAALVALVAICPQHGASFLYTSLDACDSDMRSAWNKMVVRLAAQLPSSDVHVFCSRLLDNPAYERLQPDVMLTLARTGDTEASDWLREFVINNECGGPIVSECLFVLAKQGDSLARSQLRQELLAFDCLSQDHQACLRMSILSELEIVASDSELAVAQALEKLNNDPPTSND